MIKPWYETARQEEYNALYHYSGVEVIEDEHDEAYRRTLRDSLYGRMIELRYGLRKILAPIYRLIGKH